MSRTTERRGARVNRPRGLLEASLVQSSTLISVKALRLPTSLQPRARVAPCPTCQLYCCILSRYRCAACFARLPQIAMLHHLRARPRVWSANISVQAGPSQAFTLEKSSSQTNFASASPIGRSSASGDRHRRIIRNSRPEAWPWSWAMIRPYPSSRSSSRFSGSNSLRSSEVSGRPLRCRTNPLNHARRLRA